MKKILGLDLGSSSVGWAIIEENSDEQNKIIDIGCRIIPLSVDDSNQFSKGKTITKNSDRTLKRTQRKGYDRYQLRRGNLLQMLKKCGMMYDSSLIGLKPLELWGIRARAAKEEISLQELGRVLMHLNQKRGYRSSKGDDYGDKKQSEYLQAIAARHKEIIEQNMTIGEFFYNKLLADSSFRCKEQIFPRAAYVDEFDRIMSVQKRYNSAVLTDDVIDEIRNKIIYYQRPLKSCKHLVALCEMEAREMMVGDKVVMVGPKVAPRSAPLSQVCRIWESINNIVVENRLREEYAISLEQKQAIFDFLNVNDCLKEKDLFKILGIAKNSGWRADKAVTNGLKGNFTRIAIAKALKGVENREQLLYFNDELNGAGYIDEETGEIVVNEKEKHLNLYELWHTLYSISDQKELKSVLRKKYGIENEDALERLCKLDFVKMGYANKSSKAMRRILPYLKQGYKYAVASSLAGYKETSLTKEENEQRELLAQIKPIAKGELRQPVVEKILNQMINVVNALMAKYGKFDEIRVELARELKQSRAEREDSTKAINENEAKNKKYAERIKEYGLSPTLSRVKKYKMWEETSETCIYCGKVVDAVQFLQGFEVEVEHIIPKSLLFDDSFSNKVCACRACNKEKNNRTAYDYMKSKGEVEFQSYVDRVNDLYKQRKISKTKYNKLLMPATEIPDDFINRELRETQYISKKAKEILNSVCHNVVATSGSVTDFLRHIWGYDKVLHNLNLPQYRKGGLTERVEVSHAGQTYIEERIIGWSKRLDHRHHAIDALVIACTKQGYIQQLNNLSSLKDIPFESFEKQGVQHREKMSKLQRYIDAQPHFTTAEVQSAVENILVSFKAGKRVTTPGKRYVHRGGKRILVQRGVLVPRGALSEESVYGCIKQPQTDKKGNLKYVDEYVIKYPLSAIDAKCLKDVVDKGIRDIIDKRLKEYDGNAKNAFAEPLLDHRGCVIKSVRCRTGLKAVAPVRYNDNGEAVAFVKPGNNHHVAVYADKDGALSEHIVTFWNAVERKKYGVPVVVENTDDLWENITDDMNENFIAQLPARGLSLKYSMQLNEMFVLGMSDDEFADAVRICDYKTLSKHLYRVQKLAAKYYVFRHHLETSVDDKFNGEKDEAKSMAMGKFIRVTSINALKKWNPCKVKISLIGKIVKDD